MVGRVTMILGYIQFHLRVCLHVFLPQRKNIDEIIPVYGVNHISRRLPQLGYQLIVVILLSLHLRGGSPMLLRSYSYSSLEFCGAKIRII